MRRDEYPEPHHITVVSRDLPTFPEGGASFESVETVLIDGAPVCLARDALLRIEPSVGGAGHHVTMEVVAGTLTVERYEEPPYVPKHLAKKAKKRKRRG